MIENECVKKAEEELEYLSGDAETRRLAELREKAIMNEKFVRTRALREEITKEKKNTARKMLVKDMDINLIVEITGLTKEEIENL